jgi:hypothetical protein
MPDILGYWDRRSDDEDYVGDDAFGNALYKTKEQKIKLTSLEEERLQRLINKLGKNELINRIRYEY